jgi:hypothetical protein
LFIGDFNFYRSLEDRNREGGNMQDIIIFNEVISNLGLQEMPLKGRNFTWSNMQQNPILKQIDWCFTSTNWISDYLSTLLIPLSRPTLDHTPCMVQIQTSIPKTQIFIFENFWIDQPDFLDVVQAAWNTNVRASNSATRLSAKLKHLRRVLRRWAKGLSRLREQIISCNDTLLVLDKLEENRPLFVQERNFRSILKRHILKLLQWQKEYWKKDIDGQNWVMRVLSSFMLQPQRGSESTPLPVWTQKMAVLLWEEYKNRLGCSTHTDALQLARADSNST